MWVSLQSPWLSTAVLQTPQEGSSSRVSSRRAVSGRVIAASNRVGCGAVTADTELRTRAGLVRLGWVRPGTTEFSSRGLSASGSGSQHQLLIWLLQPTPSTCGSRVMAATGGTKGPRTRHAPLGTTPSGSLCEIPFLLFCLRMK